MHSSCVPHVHIGITVSHISPITIIITYYKFSRLKFMCISYWLSMFFHRWTLYTDFLGVQNLCLLRSILDTNSQYRYGNNVTGAHIMSPASLMLSPQLARRKMTWNRGLLMSQIKDCLAISNSLSLSLAQGRSIPKTLTSLTTVNLYSVY